MRETLDRKEEALLVSREAEREAGRARHQFLANMSHELRIPLHSIIGFSSYLLAASEDGLPPGSDDLIRRIHGSGSNLLRLVDMLLDLSKIEAGWVILEASRVDVRALVRSTAREMRGQIGGRPLEVRVEGEEGLDLIETDAGKLKLILVNLLGNALKYTQAGCVTARVERDASSRRPGHVDVIDTGPGIPADLRPAIAEVLDQGGGVTHRGGRTCLGLGIAAAIAKQIGARITLQPGPVTVFRVHLPMGIPTGAKTVPPRDPSGAATGVFPLAPSGAARPERAFRTGTP